jgi:urease accessory protein
MTGWDARLQLGFVDRAGKTVLAQKAHSGPLTIQKCLYPEGPSPAHVLIIHPPGGVAGGDRLSLSFTLSASAKSFITTPGATKWYKSAGRQASQTVEIKQQNDSILEWFPQENIVFDGADITLKTHVQLSQSAHFAGWDISCLGRQASGEQWRQGRYQQVLQIKRDDQLIWQENAVFKPDSLMLTSIAGLRGFTVFGSFVVTAGHVPDSVIEQCRQVTLNSKAQYGISALPEVFTARYIGNCAQEARQYFEQLWSCLRPWYANSQAIRPRIWAT